MVGVAQLVELQIVVLAVAGSNPVIHPLTAFVAQLDRAPDFESVGRRFDSCRAQLCLVFVCELRRADSSAGRAADS